MERQLIPQQNPYKIERLLGEGSNSTVFLASRSNTGLAVQHQVALKIPKSKNWVAYSEKELTSLKSVDSPYCVRLLGLEQFSERTAMVLEYVEGVSLRELMAGGDLEHSVAFEIARQVQQGLLDLKGCGLCHGDLSPANILINKKAQVKLVDFGLANSDPGSSQFTPRYAAPEVLLGELASYAADLFSLGQILEEGLGRKLGDQALKSVDPSSRRPLAIPINNGAKADLSKKILMMLESRPDISAATRQVFPMPTKEKLVLGAKWHLLFYLALGFVPCSHSLEAEVTKNSLSQISIRTHPWTDIYIDNNSVGFTPVEKYAISPGSHVLRWRQHRRQGLVTIVLRPGEHRVLRDDFFTDRKLAGALAPKAR